MTITHEVTEEYTIKHGCSVLHGICIICRAEISTYETAALEQILTQRFPSN